MKARILAEENRKWWTLAAVSFALFMIMLDNTVVNVALPGDPARPRDRRLRARVGRHRLRAQLRRPDAHRRQARRHARTPPHLPLRPRRLHGLLAALRARRERRAADRRPRAPGRRRGLHDARHPLDHHRHVPAQGARRRARHLGGRLGDGARDRPARRRPDHRAHRLELDLLHQRPRRPRRPRRRTADHPGVEGHLARAAPRPPRPDHLGRRALRARLRADRGEQPRLDVAADPRALRARARVRAPRSSCSSSTSGCRSST